MLDRCEEFNFDLPLNDNNPDCGFRGKYDRRIYYLN